jgi:4-carboxymuconolactone decarboxylase
MMARVTVPTREELPADAQRVYDDIVGARGALGGPFGQWVRVPRLADPANRLGNALRLDGRLDRRLFELLILTIARLWSAQYEWYAHEEAARKAGVSDPVIEALRRGERPSFARDDEARIYELTRELLETRTVSDATYRRAEELLGLELLVETITAIGFYTTAAMMINTFQAPVPGGARPLP